MRERCKDLVGMHARLKCDVVRKDGEKIPKGTVVLIEHTWRGNYVIVGPKNLTVRQVARNYLELMP